MTPDATSIITTSIAPIAGERGAASSLGYALSPEDIREFQELVANETGSRLPTREALDRATELIALIRMLISPLPEDPERQFDTSSNIV